MREIKEELETEIEVGELIDIVEYDYPTFHLSMDCFWAEVVSGELVLKEHEVAKWLTMDEWNSVEWLPAYENRSKNHAMYVGSYEMEDNDTSHLEFLKIVYFDETVGSSPFLCVNSL